MIGFEVCFGDDVFDVLLYEEGNDVKEPESDYECCLCCDCLIILRYSKTNIIPVSSYINHLRNHSSSSYLRTKQSPR